MRGHLGAGGSSKVISLRAENWRKIRQERSNSGIASHGFGRLTRAEEKRIRMKPAPFDYVLASSIDEATRYLADGNGEAIILAGGQTLMPMLSMRLARPELLIDINEIDELCGIEETEVSVVIKACTRQVTALCSEIVKSRLPLLHTALHFVGHLQTRNRGTFGGSLAHSDPAAEIPLVALAMDAEVELRKVNGSRRIAMKDYLVGPLITAREPDELLVAVHLPTTAPDSTTVTSFHEVSERHGDFAVVAVAAQLTFDRAICTKASIAFGGVDDTPVRIPEFETELIGQTLADGVPDATLDLIANRINPGSDQHASADYRRRVAQTLAHRAVSEAVANARETECKTP